MKTTSRSICSSLISTPALCIAAIAIAASSAHAVDYTWDGTANLWGSAHWDAGAGLVTFPGGNSNANTGIINAGTVTFGGNDTFGNAGTASSPVINLNGGTLASGAFFNTLWNLNLAGGTLLANGGVNASFPAFQLAGTVTVSGSVASLINASTVNANNAINIGGTGNGTLTFNVGDVTGNANADLTINNILKNGSAVGVLAKSGAGTLVLTAANTYTGGTAISAGTLQLGNAAALGAATGTLTVNGGTVNLATISPTTGALSGSGGTITKSAGGATNYTTSTAANSAYAGTFSNGAGQLNLTKSGTGTLTLTGAGSTLGDVTVDGGGGLTFGTGASLSTLTTSRLLLGLSAGVSGTMTVDTGGTAVTFGGSPFNLANYIGVDGGTGTLNVTSGVLNFTGMASGDGHLHVGSNGGVSNGAVTVAGGTMNVGTRLTMGVGYPGSDAVNVVGANGNGNATLTINSGTVNIGTGSGVDTDRGSLYLKSTTGGTGAATVNLNGGTLSLNRFAVGTGGTSKTVNFNGGTVQARGSDVNFLNAAANLSAVVKAGGALVNTNGFDITATAPLIHDSALGGTADGGLTKIGNGTLTLPGAHTFTGNIAVNGGTLGLSAGSYAGSLTLANGTRLASATNLVGALTVPTLTLGTSTTVDFHFGVGNDLITISNPSGFTLGSTAINLFQDGNTSIYSAPGTYTLFDYNTAFAGSVGAFSIANPIAGKGYAFANDTVGTTIQLTITNLASQWIATSGGLWTDAANWNASGVPNGVGAAAEFSTSIVGAATVNVNGPKTVGSITFSNATDSYTVSGSGSDPITLNTGTASPAAIPVLGTHTISAPLVLASNLSITAPTGSSLALSGNVSGAKAITFGGGGTLILSGANSFTTTTISSGTVQVGSGGTAGTLGSGAVANSGTLVLNRSDDFTIAGDISGTGDISKIGANKVTLGGTNTFTGPISATGGTVELGSLAGIAAITLDAATFSTTASISSARPISLGAGGGTVKVASGTTLTATGAVSGGLLAKTGDGTLTLSTASTTTGLSVDAGTLVFTGAGTLGAATPISVAIGATLRFSRNDTFGNHATAVSQAITLNGGAITNGGNFFTTLGAVTLNGGTINSIGGANASFPSFSLPGPVTVGGGAASTISGAGANSQMVVGANTASSQTTFDVADATGDSTSDLNVTVLLQNNRDAGSVEVPTGIVKTGAGKMTLAGANTFTGLTSVQQGTLVLTGSLSGSVNVATGADFDVSGVGGGFVLGGVQTLSGTGNVVGSTTVNGTLAPGNSIGTLNFSSTLTLSGTSAFEISKSGITLASDLAAVSGALTLGGTLNVTVSGDALAMGDTFDLFNAPTFSGTFTTLNLPALDIGLEWDATNLGTDGTLTVVPEPGSAVLLLAGLGMLIRRRRS